MGKKQNTYDVAMQIIKTECHSCSRWDTCGHVCDRVMEKYKETIKEIKNEGNKM